MPRSPSEFTLRLAHVALLASAAFAELAVAPACLRTLPELSPRRQPEHASATAAPALRASGAEPPPPMFDPEPVNDFEAMLRGRGDKFASYLGAAESLRLQVLFGEVVDDGAGHRGLRRHAYRLDAEYFYPASAIKLCAAVCALEKISFLRRTSNASIEPGTPARFFGLSESSTSQYASSIGQEVRAALVISENESYNRLFGFVGHREMNERMWALGARSVRALHRVVLPGGKVITTPRRVSTLSVPRADVAGLDVGTAHVEGNRMVSGPMQFAKRNRVSLRDLQDLLIKITRPELLPGTPLPELDEPERVLLLEVLRTVPSESKTPYYAPGDFPDVVHKPFLPGLLRTLSREKFALYSKGGMAYGFRVENAYIEGIPRAGGLPSAFFLAVAMFADADGTVNDDTYDYAAVADPFLADIAELVARQVWSRQPAVDSAK
jgi:hypothetical protein